LKVSYKKEH